MKSERTCSGNGGRKKKVNTEFYENRTNVLVADKRSQIDEWTDGQVD